MGMSHQQGLATLRHQLTDLLRAIHLAQGRREAMQQREAALVRDVGLAKGRLELKPKVDAFLEELQAEANERAVGAYARLLTGLVHDVLGTHAGTVELDLYTNHGLPALDIFIRTPGGKKVSILNHTAGSFINLICMGLRATSTVRSGKRKFIALDEPDCWIRPTRVPVFYAVIDQLAKSLGIQIIVVSHHDPSLLPEGTAIVKLRLGSEGTIEVEPDPEATRWQEDQEGIRYIRLSDYRTHKDSVVPLSPGVTAIVGDNAIGKSHVLHAFRSLCYGDIEEGDIRDEEGIKSLGIEMGIEKGVKVCLTRQIGRNPVNEWSVLDAQGEVLHDETSGHPLRAGGRVPPDFVREMTGIMRMEGLDPQLSHQLFPVFLLGEPPSKRASVLSIGRESGHISSMIARQKSRCQQDTSTVRRGEKEIGDLRERLGRLQALDSLQERAAECEEQLEAIEASHARARRMQGFLERFDRARRRHLEFERKLAAYESMPNDEAVEALAAAVSGTEKAGDILSRWEEARMRHQRAKLVLESLKDLPEEPPVISDVARMRKMGTRLSGLMQQKQYHEAVLSSLASLPDEPPQLSDTRSMAGSLNQLGKLAKRRADQETEFRRLEKETEVAREAIEEVLQELGNACPTCGSFVESAEAIIGHGGEHSLMEENAHA